jgi:hypothetical protein
MNLPAMWFHRQRLCVCVWGGGFTRARTTQGEGRVGAGARDILYRGREYLPTTKSPKVVELHAEAVERIALTARPHVGVS